MDEQKTQRHAMYKSKNIFTWSVLLRLYIFTMHVLFSSKNYVVSNNYTHEPKTNMKNNINHTITYYSADY